jgi:peptidoglycan/xylan/chitin deacetylase (PgdA/CDA1 family)
MLLNIKQYLFIFLITMLMILICCKNNIRKSVASDKNRWKYSFGAIIRGDTTRKEIALVFTGDEFGDGGQFIARTLKNSHVKGSFFLTGNFYRSPGFQQIIRQLKEDGNYLGSHSDKHLLYCDWVRRDSILVTKDEFDRDITDSYKELGKFGVDKSEARYFLPPYEWYNDSISAWTGELGLRLVNFSPGTRSSADYTYPEMGKGYVDSRSVNSSIINFEKASASGLNGFILLIHIGTDPRRTDKFYSYLPDLITELKAKGYKFVRIDELLPEKF